MLKEIFKDHKGWIIFTYSVTVLEFVIFGLLPYLLGRAIDALLAEQTNDFMLYIGCCVTGLVIGFFRRRMDTRVFMNIWRRKATFAVGGLIDRGISTPKLFSRAELVKLYPDFFEFTVPMAISSVLEIVIASVMICLVVPWAGLVVTALAVLSVLFAYFFSCVIRVIELRLQKIREKKDDALSNRDLEGITEEYQCLQKEWVSRSDLAAYCWGVCDLLGIVAIVILIVAITKENFTAGVILASVTYCVKMFMRSVFLAYFFNHIQEIDVANQFLNSD